MGEFTREIIYLISKGDDMDRGIAGFNEHEEQRERREIARLQRQLFDEFTYRVTSTETVEERDIRLYYSRPELCECKHTLNGHEWPMGKCMEDGCKCEGFVTAHHTEITP